MSKYAVVSPGGCSDDDDPEYAKMWLTNGSNGTLYIDAAMVVRRLRAAMYGDIVVNGEVVAYKLDRPALDALLSDVDVVLGVPTKQTAAAPPASGETGGTR